MIPRTIFTEDHRIFRETVRKFMANEVEPHREEWEKAGVISREAWTKAGAAGLLCPDMPEAYGGGGGDFLHAAVIMEEQARIGASGPGFSLHSNIVAPYILHYGSEAQKRAWLPRMATGETVTAIAMTEPGTGSDLQAIKTRAVRDGNEIVLNGQKTFITNGQLADLTIVVAKTDPGKGAEGVSLVLVEAEREGFSRGRNLEKIGLKAQDTSELFFEDVRLPPENILGEDGQGFAYLMQQLPQERLMIAVTSVASAETALEHTIRYAKEREAFGRPIIKFQNTRFKLAELKAEVTVARTFLDRCLELHMEGALDVTTAATAKLWTTEMQGRVIDACLQLHGGYGYMWEYPIARAYADSRVSRIFGGTSEIMKELIGRSL